MNRVVESMKNLKIKDFFKWKYIFYLLKVSGVAPMNLNIESVDNMHEKDYKFSHSSINIAYNLFVIMFIVISNYFATYDYLLKVGRVNEPMYNTLDLVGFVSAICVVMVFCMKCKQQIIVFNKVIEIRGSISKHWKDEGNNLRRKVNVVFLMHIFNWLALAISDSFNDFDYAMFCLSLDFCHFVITSVTIQYWIVVEIMKHLYANLNAKLSDYSKHVDFSDGFTSVAQIEDELLHLWSLHGTLNKVSRDISSFFSISMILITMNTLLVPTSIIYNIIGKPMVIGTAHKQLGIMDYVCGIFFVTPYFFSIILLTSCITATVDENKKTREIVNAVLRKSQSRVIRDKVYQFSITMLNEVVEFKVFDLFSLNGSLVVSIVASVTAYLIILLQFQSKKCTSQD